MTDMDYSFKNKRFVPWTDEVLWKETARLSGLTYGVYDITKNRRCTDEEQNGIITNYHDARQRAIEMNNNND